uniref:Uncharacterized protein n=1 Tax=Arundo donax TaxID=35708 RepID=A0A0A9EIU4_ARUDO
MHSRLQYHMQSKVTMIHKSTKTQIMVWLGFKT